MVIAAIVLSMRVEVDSYIFETLMRDLNGHDRRPSAFIVYLHLWANTRSKGVKALATSHQQIADAVGLSKRAVQQAIGLLLRRKLLRLTRLNPTAKPIYEVRRPWAKKRQTS
jgi:hypothetical protein